MIKHITLTIKCGKDTCMSKIGDTKNACQYLWTMPIEFRIKKQNCKLYLCQLFNEGLDRKDEEYDHRALRCKKCKEIAK